jgi:hypothetical protein
LERVLILEEQFVLIVDRGFRLVGHSLVLSLTRFKARWLPGRRLREAKNGCD